MLSKKSQPIFIVFFLLITSSPLYSETRLEQRLRHDIEDYHLDFYTRVEAAFILSGADHSDTLHTYLMWYRQLLEDIREFYLDPFDRVGSAGKIFSYLHSSWLRSYEEKATTLIDVVKEKRYNCVAGTILYNLVCEDLGFPTEAFETPTHTYTVFPNFSQRLMVENTTPMGFDIMKNLREYSEYLLQFYPDHRAAQIGLDRLHDHEFSKGRSIDNTELLGLLAYNRAYFAVKQNDFESAYDYVRLARSFNRDSRSNLDFEIELYFRWGNRLFDAGRFHRAFDLYADARERYWENEDYAHNCKAAFFNALGFDWQNKKWGQSRRIVDRVMHLDVLSDREWEQLEKVLQNWANYWFAQRRKQESLQVISFLDQIDPGDPQLYQFKKAVNALRE